MLNTKIKLEDDNIVFSRFASGAQADSKKRLLNSLAKSNIYTVEDLLNCDVSKIPYFLKYRVVIMQNIYKHEYLDEPLIYDAIFDMTISKSDIDNEVKKMSQKLDNYWEAHNGGIKYDELDRFFNEWELIISEQKSFKMAYALGCLHFLDTPKTFVSRNPWNMYKDGSQKKIYMYFGIDESSTDDVIVGIDDMILSGKYSPDSKYYFLYSYFQDYLRKRTRFQSKELSNKIDYYHILVNERNELNNKIEELQEQIAELMRESKVK